MERFARKDPNLDCCFLTNFFNMVLVIDLSYNFNSRKWKWTKILRTDSVVCALWMCRNSSFLQHSFLTLSITDPQQDEQNGQKTLAEDGLVFRSPEMKRSLQRPNSSKKKKMSKKSKHTNRPQDRPKPSSHPATANPANGHQNHHSKSNSSSEDSDNSDSFYETLRRHQRKHRTSSKNSSSNSNVSAAKK